MGTWSHEPFGNDTACDWSFELQKEKDLSLICRALDAVIEKQGYLEAEPATEALAAVEVLAKLLGRGTQSDSYTEGVDEWVAQVQTTPGAGVLSKAGAAIDRILGSGSELNELWEESDEAELWKKSVLQLRAALIHAEPVGRCGPATTGAGFAASVASRSPPRLERSEGKNDEKWDLGSIFAIRLSDGTHTFGQVLEDSKYGITAGFFDLRAEAAHIDLSDVQKKRLYSILEVTTNHLIEGRWHVIGTKSPVVWQWRFPNFRRRLLKGGVGSKSYTSPLVQNFIEAYFGLLPWNHFDKMPQNYFDEFLLKWQKVSPNKVFR